MSRPTTLSKCCDDLAITRASFEFQEIHHARAPWLGRISSWALGAIKSSPARRGYSAGDWGEPTLWHLGASYFVLRGFALFGGGKEESSLKIAIAPSIKTRDPDPFLQIRSKMGPWWTSKL